jgi:hypothetical protein
MFYNYGIYLGADKVFKWALYSMPFLLVWCLLTEKRNPLIKWVFIGQCTHLCILMLC